MPSTVRNPAKGRGKTRAPKAPSMRIHKAMSVSDIVALLPEAEPVLAQYGLHCFNCSANMTETLEDGYLSHGFPENELDDLVKDLNTLLKNKPKRPKTLIITKEAAKALLEIAKAEAKPGQGLQVGTDQAGGFCMEFRDTPEEESLHFFHREVPEMRLFATDLTLSRIGGSTIDFREDRFKLDLPEDAHVGKKECTCGKGECGCGGHT